MPLPPDDNLDNEINALYDTVLERAVQPGHFGIVTAESARLQAASQRRLVVAIERAAQAQDRMAAARDRTNREIQKLERMGLGV